MAGSELHLAAKCPRCLASLLCPGLPPDGLPSIELLAALGGRIGRVHLSQVYGSRHRALVGLPDIPGSEERFACPRCLRSLPARETCVCGAAMFEVDLDCGGVLRLCARNGCREHHLEFAEIDDAFVVFENQEE